MAVSGQEGQGDTHGETEAQERSGKREAKKSVGWAGERVGWGGRKGQTRGEKKEGKDIGKGSRERGSPKCESVRGHRGGRSGIGQGPHLPEFLCPS